jgi:uncharacterized membrane protein YdfJ with MMPL/SSD domain
MGRLAGLLERRRWALLGAWAAIVAAAVPFALRQSDALTASGFAVAGSQSTRAEQVIGSQIAPEFRATVLAGVLVGHGSRTDVVAALGALRRATAGVRGVSMPRVISEFALYEATHRPGRPVLVPLAVSVSEFDAPDVAARLRGRLGLASGGGRFGALQLHLVGQGALWAGVLDLSKHDLAHAERLGFPIVFLILLAVFGSLAAAALPLALGGVAVVVTGALVYWLSRVTAVNVYATNVASMIGIGVAVDYALFVLVRFREELRAGAAPSQARLTAMRTSGLAVVYSGLAVAGALAALLLVSSSAVRSLAVASIVVVAVSVLASATLLPALLGVAERRTRTRRPPRAFARWAQAVMARPAWALAAGLVVMLALSLPAIGLRVADGALTQFPRGNETRAGFEAARQVTGPGRGSPVKLLVPTAGLDRAVALLRADPEVVLTGVRTRTRDHRLILVVATARHDGDSAAVRALVRRLRRELPRGTIVGGNTAAQIDFDHAVVGSLWKVALLVVALAFAVLLALLRAPLLALQAVLANVLSVGVAYGVLSAVFVHGWLPVGLEHPGYVDTIAIPLVFVIVFGLSMDYEVFLLSRVRERRLQGAGTRDAVGDAVGTSARTITSAALVMVAVFVVFVITGVPAIQEVGLGCAVAIAVDATVVRLVLVPAAMALAGERCWWTPARGARTTA